MADDTFTHKDLAQLLGVSATTIKNYRSKFSEFFEVRGKGKPLRFALDVARVCRDIRDCVRQGLSVEETRAQLREHYPRVHSRGQKKGLTSDASTAQPQLPPELIDLIPSLAGGLERLAALQDKTNQRLERLEAVLAERLLGDLEKDSALSEVRSMLAAWQAEQEEGSGPGWAGQGRDGPGSSGMSGRLVRVRNAYGEVQEYHLEAAPASDPISAPVSTPASAAGSGPVGIKKTAPHTPEEVRPEAPLDAASAPQADFLEMPLVLRSERGEYLGVGGRGAGPFSTSDLMGLMSGRFTVSNAFSFHWEARDGGGAGKGGPGAPGGWSLRAAQGQGPEGKGYLLELERARTPRGNDVVLVWSLEVDGKEVSPVFLHNFIRQMMDMAEPREDNT
jgi:DNA-binding transcriptional MerR regulator